MGERASRVENQDATDACVIGMLPDPKEEKDCHRLVPRAHVHGNWSNKKKTRRRKALDTSNLSFFYRAHLQYLVNVKQVSFEECR
ncbi:hypothetical protein Tco_0176148 [Tanacetum coccineum]